MRIQLIVAAGVFALAACGTARFAPSVEKVAEATRKIDTEIATILKPDFEAARAEELRQAALGNDLWVLSPECLKLAEASATPPLASCEIQKTVFGDRQPPPNLASDIARKSSVLSNYVDALGVLSSADSEEEMFAALAVARTSLGKLGDKSGSDGLQSFVAGLDDNKDKIEGLGKAAFDALRFRKLKKIVGNSDAAVSDLVAEIQIGLLALGKDPAYLTRSLRLQSANGNAQALRGQGSAAVAAYAELEAAHADFVKNYASSLIGRVGLVAQAHSGLAAALRQPDSSEQVVAYLEALRGLVDTIKE